jgi:hypothetical protein
MSIKLQAEIPCCRNGKKKEKIKWIKIKKVAIVRKCLYLFKVHPESFYKNEKKGDD